MRIVFINTNDSKGGAAIAVTRLCKLLIKNDIEVFLFVQNKNTLENYIYGPNTIFQKIKIYFNIYFDKIILKLYPKKKSIPFHINFLNNSNLVNKINSLKPDIVHLHWINNGMLSIRDLTKINSPLVWTLHDDWIFTGGCNIKYDCKNYITLCNKCTALNSSKKFDISYFQYKYKKHYLSQIKNLNFISPSNWLTSDAKKSNLLKNFNIHTIPNPIDTKIFSPFSKIYSRKLLGLPINKKIILFGASDATSDPNKGFKYLYEALSFLKNDNIHFVVFGSTSTDLDLNISQIHFLGHLHDEYTLNLLYNSSDVMIVPSLQENLPQTAIESLSCGTPVVAFRTSGLVEIIDHYKTGYLAEPYNSFDLSNGINWLINLSDYELNKISIFCREKVLSNYSYETTIKMFTCLYNQILTK
jgi:glycosyltransferase involved in cell wall biosynthesis